MTRTNYVAAMDALEKLLEIAALDLGGSPADYDIGDERVFLKADPSNFISYAAAATRAIQIGGKYSGQIAPEDINSMTRNSVAALAGTGLIGVAKDNLDYVGVADCGTVLHPLGLGNQIKSAAFMGFGMAGFERHAYDPQNGLPANSSLYLAKPPTYLDALPT